MNLSTGISEEIEEATIAAEKTKISRLSEDLKIRVIRLKEYLSSFNFWHFTAYQH